MLTIYVQNGNKVGFSLLFGVGGPPSRGVGDR